MSRISSAVLCHTNGRGFVVPGSVQSSDGDLELRGGAVRAPSQPFAGELGEPVLDQVQP